MKDKLISKLSAIKQTSFHNIPSRTKIFFSALWFWAYIFYYFSKMINYMLYIFITYTPDSCIIFRSITSKDEKIPEIINAKIIKKTHVNDTDNDTDTELIKKIKDEFITNKLNMILKWKWDEDIGDFGGIKIKELISKFPSISSSVLLISYLFNMDKKIEKFQHTDVEQSIKHMLIDMSDKMLYRNNNLNNPEDILFGNITF